jgi:hypothetical protein
MRRSQGQRHWAVSGGAGGQEPAAARDSRDPGIDAATDGGSGFMAAAAGVIGLITCHKSMINDDAHC